MKAYPVSVRLEILAAVDGGMPKSTVARAFGVSLASVKRFAVQRRDTGTVTPRHAPGRLPLILPAQHPVVVAMVAAAPTASQATYCRRWQELGGTPVSQTTMSRTLHRLGLRRHRPSARRP